MTKDEVWYCVACDKPLSFVPRTCCGGHECDCMGQPIDPPVCSNECYGKAYPHMLSRQTQQMLDDIEREEQP